MYVLRLYLTTISTEPKTLWEFCLQKLKTCSLYHEKLFIQVVNDISSQVFNNFFSASDIMEAVRGRFHVWYEGCVIQVRLLRSMYTQQKESSLQHTHMQGCRKGEGYGGAKNRHLEFLNLSLQGLISSLINQSSLKPYLILLKNLGLRIPQYWNLASLLNNA